MGMAGVSAANRRLAFKEFWRRRGRRRGRGSARRAQAAEEGEEGGREGSQERRGRGRGGAKGAQAAEEREEGEGEPGRRVIVSSRPSHDFIGTVTLTLLIVLGFFSWSSVLDPCAATAAATSTVHLPVCISAPSCSAPAPPWVSDLGPRCGVCICSLVGFTRWWGVRPPPVCAMCNVRSLSCPILLS